MNGAIDSQPGALLLELGSDGVQVDGRASETIELRDEQDVAVAARRQRLAQPRPIAVPAGVALVGVDPVRLDAETFER